MATQFRQYNEPLFSHVVFTPAEYTYWLGDANAQIPILPALVLIRSEWESHVILESMPSSAAPLALSARKPDWGAKLAKEKRDCLMDLSHDDEVNRA